MALSADDILVRSSSPSRSHSHVRSRAVIFVFHTLWKCFIYSPENGINEKFASHSIFKIDAKWQFYDNKE